MRDHESVTERHFTVATFVVAIDRVLLMLHHKLQVWLPPGSHAELQPLHGYGNERSPARRAS